MTQALHSARATAPAAPLPSAAHDADSAITFSSLLSIARILDDARGKRATLTIRFEHASRLHVYHSRIQSIDLDHEQMVLHRLMPSNWMELVTGDVAVDVTCQLPSGLLRFSSILAPLEAETLSPYCVLALPRELHKHQLRSSYRVVMPPGAGSLALPYGEQLLPGFCLNVSLEGCCGIFRGVLDGLARDAMVHGLSVNLTGTLRFTTDASVCRRQLMQNGSTQLGLRFEPLDTELQRRLQACLTSLQRQQLRKLL